MKTELSFAEIAEAIRRYANSPNATVQFTARPVGGQLVDLTAIVEQSQSPPPQSVPEPVASAVLSPDDTT